MLALLDGAPGGLDMEERMEVWASERYQHELWVRFVGHTHNHTFARAPWLHTIRGASVNTIKGAECNRCSS
jgi:hypothetical protein